MSPPAPLHSLLGGLSIPIPVHSLLLLNGNVFGISGFIHRAAKGSLEALSGVAGLVLGGALIARLERGGPVPLPIPLSQLALAGLLVGYGTKLANGCTSGHMICGVSRFSLRSIVATATFFTTGVLTTHLLHGDWPAAEPLDWSISPAAVKLLVVQVVPLVVSSLLYAYGKISTSKKADDTKPNPAESSSENSLLRKLAFLTTGVQFAFALRLSGLSEAKSVLAFLFLPFHRAFDPSLAFVAGGALSLGILLYHFARGDERPLLGGKWSIPSGGEIDTRLIIGSILFGVGWGVAGICPGPGLVNLGRSLGSGGVNLGPFAAWVGGVVAGGLFA